MVVDDSGCDVKLPCQVTVSPTVTERVDGVYRKLLPGKVIM